MKLKRTWTIAAALLAAIALTSTACGGDDSESTGTDSASDEAAVSIEEPWSRATAPSATTGAVYMTLTADIDDELIGATVDSSIAGEAQIHEVVAADDMDDMDENESSLGNSVRLVSLQDTNSDDENGDMDDMDEMESEGDDADSDTGHGGSDGMTMQEVSEIPLPAGEAVVLEPGGYHIMLLELAAPLAAGETFEVELHFTTADTQTVTVEVRET